jgi:formiminotetrahydrofolate cyclodeaminase
VIKLAFNKSEYQKRYRLANTDHLREVEANYRKLATKRTSAYRGIIDCCSKFGKEATSFIQ